ncbi:MAG: transposase [Dehalococcoidia bacterium]|nr:transposase [Dehalococcoidia bacterium]
MRIQLLNPTTSKCKALSAMQAEYTKALSLLLESAKELDTTSLGKLHREAYHRVKTEVSLPSEALRMALNQTCHIMRSWKDRQRKGRNSGTPVIKRLQPIGVGTRGYRIMQDGERFVLRLTTAQGFLWLPLKANSYYQPFLQALSSGNIHQSDAKLVEQSGTWYFLLVARQELAEPTGENVIGVDLGVANLAVVSTPDGQVNRFFSGRTVQAKRNRFFDRRYSLQCAKLPRLVKRDRDKEHQWMKDVNHKVSRAVIQTAQRLEKPVIALEELRGIRERIKATRKVNRMLHSWAFAQLIGFIEYKAAKAGIPVVRVDPRKTSQTCSKCGHAERANRSKQARFKCKECGFELHADVQAARNIAVKAQTLVSG